MIGNNEEFDMYQVHLRNAVKVIDFSTMILECEYVCMCAYR